MKSVTFVVACALLLGSCGKELNIMDAARSGDTARVKVLVDANQSLAFVTDGNGNTPAIWAILNGHKEIVVYLVGKGYPVDGAPNYPFPLIMACCSRNDDSSNETLEFLLRSGADPNIRYEKEGWTALGMAVNNWMPEKVKLLVKFGARMDQKDGNGQTPMELAKYRLVQLRDLKLNTPHGELSDPAVRKKEIDRWQEMVRLLESLSASAPGRDRDRGI